MNQAQFQVFCSSPDSNSSQMLFYVFYDFVISGNIQGIDNKILL